jgi:uncharacterized repeat protein (TIGR01451 family)
LRSAGTPAGTILTFQTSVKYNYTGRPTPLTVSSNIVSVTVNQVAAVNIAPAVASSETRLHTTVDYPLIATNSGNGADKFTITAQSSLGLSPTIYIDDNGDGLLSPSEINAGPVVVTPELTLDASIRLVVRLTIPDDVSLTGKTDALTIEVRSSFDPSRKAIAQRSTAIISAILTASKSVSPDLPRAGDRVIYTVAYGNGGSADATEIVFSDVLDPYLRYVTGSAVPAPDTVSGQMLSWKLKTAVAGGVGSISFQVEIADNAVIGSEIHNVMTCQYSDGPNERIVRSVEANFITMQGSGSGTVDMTPNRIGSGEPGDTVQYRFVLTNKGSVPEAFDLSYSSTQGVVWTIHRDSSGTGTVSPGSPPITNTGTLSSGENFPIVAQAVLPLVSADQTQDVTTFRVRSTTRAKNQATATSTTDIALPRMSLVKIANPVQAKVGDEVTYTIMYANSGHGQAYEFVVSDVIPAGTVYVPNSAKVDGSSKSDVADADSVTVDGNVLTVRVGTIPPQGGGTIEFRVKILR